MGILVFVAGLGGCSSAFSPPWVRSPAQAGRATQNLSWMAPNAKSQDLLYVVDIGGEDVEVLTYPDGKQVGHLTGFDEPNAACVDKRGDVFITNTDALDVVEYAHGGSEPIATLSDPNYPMGCSVNLNTGDLAVSNENPASVSIYKRAKGSGAIKYYGGQLLTQVYYCSFDNAGDLFVDGFNNDGRPQLVELLRKNYIVVGITLNVRVGWTGGVEWHGKYLALGDQFAKQPAPGSSPLSAIYNVKIDGSNGTVVSTASLGDAGDVVQFWIEGSTIIGADVQNEDVGYWRYPYAGWPSKMLTRFYEPVGAAVSLAPK